MTFRDAYGSTGRLKDGAFVAFESQEDADGQPVKSSRTQTTEQASDDLPEDFPERDLILGTQYKSLDALNAASDDDLLAVDGIGPAKFTAMRAALKG